MTDQYWIHGGSINDVFRTIKYGVIEKGMIPWKDQLRAREIQEVSSYILTLQGTNPPNGKEPQGDLYEGPVENSAARDTVIGMK
jgi:cytochrome c oxidase cbb3-type subunit 3